MFVFIFAGPSLKITYAVEVTGNEQGSKGETLL